MVLRVPLEKLLSFKGIPIPVIAGADYPVRIDASSDKSLSEQVIEPKNGHNIGHKVRDGYNGRDSLPCEEWQQCLIELRDGADDNRCSCYDDENDECIITVTDADPDWETEKHTDFTRDYMGIEVDIDYVVFVGEHGFSADDFEERLYWERIEQARELEENGDTYLAAKMYKKAGHARIAKEVQWKPGISMSELRAGIEGCKLLRQVSKPDPKDIILYPEHNPYGHLEQEQNSE